MRISSNPFDRIWRVEILHKVQKFLDDQNKKYFDDRLGIDVNLRYNPYIEKSGLRLGVTI